MNAEKLEPLNPIEILNVDLHRLRLEIEQLLRELQGVQPCAANGSELRVDASLNAGLAAGLRVQAAQLEYFAGDLATTLPSDWLLFDEAIELQANWLAQAARAVEVEDRRLAKRLSGIGLAFGDLMAPTVAARLWLNDLKLLSHPHSPAVIDAVEGSQSRRAA